MSKPLPPVPPDDDLQRVDVEIVPSSDQARKGEQAFNQAVGGPPAQQGGGHWTKRTFFHPMSGLAIIGIDLMAFGGTAATGGPGVVFTAPSAFFVTLIAVTSIQMNKSGDGIFMALLKGLIGGIVAGIPLPIAGTFVGAAILMLSGLPTSPDKAMKEAQKHGMG